MNECKVQNRAKCHFRWEVTVQMVEDTFVRIYRCDTCGRAKMTPQHPKSKHRHIRRSILLMTSLLALGVVAWYVGG